MLVQSPAKKSNKYQLKQSKCQMNVRCWEIIHEQRIFTESLNFDLKPSKKHCHWKITKAIIVNTTWKDSILIWAIAICH